jgi:hypothetical protein
MRSTVRRALGALAVLLGLWLIDDALTFTLYADSSTGRMRGCFTAIEIWFGATEPRDVIRSAELVSGIGLVAGSVISLVGTSIRSRRRRRVAQAAISQDG